MRVDLAAGRARYNSSVQPATVSSVEVVIGTDIPDILRGDEHANTLNGGGGNDVISGRGGNDRLGGDAGRDKLRGGARPGCAQRRPGPRRSGRWTGQGPQLRRIRSGSMHQPSRRAPRNLM